MLEFINMVQRIDRANRLHDDLVLQIYRRPELLGINRYNVATATTEYEFRREWRMYVTPDIAYMLQDGKYVFGEVKSTPTANLRHKAYKQMEKICECCYDLDLEAEGYIIQPRKRSSNLETLITDLRVIKAFTTKGL